ncbi:MAG: hypothetical protein HQM08_29690 [Candidatus Riflebacteria bacterium]|nr:hypothetical protein [Candidatus Riflebacteria bacterium]
MNFFSLSLSFFLKISSQIIKKLVNKSCFACLYQKLFYALIPNMTLESSPFTLKNLISTARDYFCLVPEYRTGNIKYSIEDSLLSALGMFFFQEPSLLAFQEELKESAGDDNLHTLFEVSKIPKTSQFRRIIDEVKPENLFPIFDAYFKILSQNKFLQRFQILSGRYLFVLDGTEYFTSNADEKPCDRCLQRELKDGKIQYYHQLVQGSFMKAGASAVIPFAPEEICLQDGSTKQDCEVNAAKRLITRLHSSHPHLDIIINGDDIYSRVPMVKHTLENKFSFIFVAKETSHAHLYEWLSELRKLDYTSKYEKKDLEGNLQQFEWCCNVPLRSDDKLMVNWLSYTVYNKQGERTYFNTWVTNVTPTKQNIEELANAGRTKWKIENENFNILKNYGYHLEHSFGHGEKNLSFNFVVLNLLAFFLHHVQRLAVPLFQLARAKARTGYNFFEKLRSAIDFFVWESWESLLEWVFIKRKPVRAPP